jgi:hypothetical protein
MSKVSSPLRDTELVEMLADDPELLAIADAFVVAPGERLAGEHRPSRARMAGLVGLPGLAAVAAVVALVFVWPFSSSPSVLDSALAAIGTAPVTHVVLQEDLGSYLLDLRSGKRTATSGREEIWYQPNRGLLSESSFDGKHAGTQFVPATIRGMSSGAADYVSAFASRYRAKLRRHAFHVTGSGTLYGTPVYWISSTPTYIGRDPSRRQVEQAAISKSTYKPLYFRMLYNNRIVPGSQHRVLSIETTATAPPALNGRQPTLDGYGWAAGYPQLTLKQVRATRPRPLIPAKVAGLRLSWTGSSPFTKGPSSLTIAGVWLYYGALYNTGLPDDIQPAFTGPYIEVFEFPHANLLTRFFTGRFPAHGVAVIDGLPARGPGIGVEYGAHTATLHAHGLYLLIQASTQKLAIAVAKVVSR